MAEPAVLQATFADWRTVKGRKQLQLIFEVPIEQQAHVLSVLGAPLSDTATWVAIARLVASPAPRESVPVDVSHDPPRYNDRGEVLRKNPTAVERGKALYASKDDMAKAASRAAMLRRDPEYQRWMAYYHAGDESVIPTLPMISAWQRADLGVESCSEIASSEAVLERWKAHLLSFEQAVGRAAMPS